MSDRFILPSMIFWNRSGFAGAAIVQGDRHVRRLRAGIAETVARMTGLGVAEENRALSVGRRSHCVVNDVAFVICVARS